MMNRFILLGALMTVMTLVGCAGPGEVVQLRLHDVMHSTMEQAGGNLSVVVSNFEDQRTPSDHFGSHVCIMGHITHYDLMGENIGESVTTAFVDFLNKSGFQAAGGGSGPANVRISGTISEFSAQATGSFLSTNMQVDTIMDFVISNVADGSTVHMKIGAGGTDDVLFYGADDLETLVNEVLQEGFEELIEQTEVQGKTLRRKI